MTTMPDLEFDLDELIGVFGIPLPLSNPELLDYWFRFDREDGVSVTLSLSGYERSVAIIVRMDAAVACSLVRIERCARVRVLEPDRKTVEVVGDKPPVRCFLALNGESILDVQIPG